MSFNISYIFEIQDKMTATLNKISGQMQVFSGRIQQQADGISGHFNKMSNNINNSFLRASNGLQNFNNKMQNFSQKMFGFRNQALFISAPVGLFGKKAYDEFASYDTLLLQMRTTFGEAADAMIKEGNRIADSTALAPQQAFQLLSKIKQTGSLNNEEIVKVTNDLINTVYGVGASKQFDRIAWQFSQVLTKGELELEDIKTIAEAGLPIFTMLGDTLGKTPQELLDIIGEKGVIGISAKNVTDMLDKYGKIHKDAQEKFAKSAEGKLQILSESYSKFSRKFGELMEQAGYGDMITSLTKFFNFLSEKIDKMSPLAKKFVFYFTMLAVVLPPILMAIGLIASTIGFISAGIGALGAAVAPFFAIAALVVAIGAGIIIFRKEIWNAIKATVEFFYKWTGIKFIFESVGKVIMWLSDKLTSFLSKFSFVQNVSDYFFGGLDESQQLRRPQSAITSEDGMSPLERLANNRAQQQAQVGIQVNVANAPVGTNVQTAYKGAPYAEMGKMSIGTRPSFAY